MDATVVALRKESVDRNKRNVPAEIEYMASLSARRAWIEIQTATANFFELCRRSPQGERG